MKRTTSFIVVAATLTFAACGGGGSSGYGGSTPAQPAPAPTPTPTPPPAAAAPTNFTAFMRTQFEAAATSDATDPTDVESVEWVFTDEDDETEYDDVLATSM